MPADRDRLRAHYAAAAEWARLESDEGWLEHRRTMVLIERHISTGSRVLDLGGGPGRYTLALAARGDDVTLVDLSPELIAEASRRIAAAGLAARALVGDAADLSTVPGAPFDAVLALGPLYHAADLSEVRGFVGQIAAVLRPGGVLLAAFVPRTSALSDLIARAASDLPPGALGAVLESGQHGGAFFAHPEQIAAVLDADFRLDGIASLRGLGSGYGAQLRGLQGLPVLEEVMSLIDATAARPDVVGMGWHAVAIARRR